MNIITLYLGSNGCKRNTSVASDIHCPGGAEGMEVGGVGLLIQEPQEREE